MFHKEYKVQSGLFGDFETVTFEPTPKQHSILLNIKNLRLNVIRKSRQVGITTTLAIGMVDRAYREPGVRIIYVTPKRDMGYQTKHLINSLLDKGDIELDSNNKITLKNSSTIEFVTTSKELSGMLFDWVVFDEAAYINNLALMIGMCHTRPSCDITLASTPLHKKTDFNDYYFKAIAGENFFHPTDYLWYDHPVFGKDVYWSRGAGSTKKIYDNGDPEMIIRLLELGFFRTSKAYEKHLWMYGDNPNLHKIEMDAQMM